MKNFWNLPLYLVRLIASLILCWLAAVFAFAMVVPAEASLDGYEMEIFLTGVAVALIINTIIDYNSVQSLKHSVFKCKADIETAIELEKSLLDKAERVTDKYMNAEVNLYSKFADARIESSQNVKSRIRSGKDFKAVVESYPELQANIHTQKLLNQIEMTEGNIQNKKNDYTTKAAKYNTKIHTFPAVALKVIFRWKDIDMSPVLLKEEIVTDEELGI